ncbi:MAG: anhydro-N-acetylmuramic acid kinase, partial [Methylotenera sp.]
GNMLLDMWVKRYLNLDYDENGNWARSGALMPELLNKMLEDPYFSMAPPKSTGRDLFNAHWLNLHLNDSKYAPENVARTLTALSAISIYQAISDFCGDVQQIYLCGGGAKNSLLIEELAACMPDTLISNTDTLGVGTDWAEAIAFAWLAKQCIHGVAMNLSAVTGASGPRILGAVYPA